MEAVRLLIQPDWADRIMPPNAVSSESRESMAGKTEERLTRKVGKETLKEVGTTSCYMQWVIADEYSFSSKNVQGGRPWHVTFPPRSAFRSSASSWL